MFRALLSMSGAMTLTVSTVLLSASSLHAAEGLITVTSPLSVDKTVERLEGVLEEKGLTVFSIVDHAEGAAAVGEELSPTQVVIFGNPAVGTKLMQCSPSAAIDLPQKMLIWSDSEGQTQLAYNDPQYLSERHGLDNCAEVLAKISGVLDGLAEAATQPE